MTTSLSHDSLMNIFKTSVNNIIQNDKILNDLYPNITLEEVNNLLSLEHGHSMILFIKRGDDQTMNVIVRQDATLKDLKTAIKRYISLKHARNTNNNKTNAAGSLVLNWKYVWKRYCLKYENEFLLDDKKPLKEYGIYNKSHLTFHKKPI